MKAGYLKSYQGYRLKKTRYYWRGPTIPKEIPSDFDLEIISNTVNMWIAQLWKQKAMLYAVNDLANFRNSPDKEESEDVSERQFSAPSSASLPQSKDVSASSSSSTSNCASGVAPRSRCRRLFRRKWRVKRSIREERTETRSRSSRFSWNSSFSRLRRRSNMLRVRSN